MTWRTGSNIASAWSAMAYGAAWITNITWAAYAWRAMTFIASSYTTFSSANTIIAKAYWAFC